VLTLEEEEASAITWFADSSVFPTSASPEPYERPTDDGMPRTKTTDTGAGGSNMIDHKTATHEEWLAARGKLLEREKELTRMNDELARQRRELPWVPVEKEYSFETVEGAKSLAELFDGRSQMMIYHFMFGPSYEAGCPVCSSITDNLDANAPHLAARDVTVLLSSRAPLEKLQAYKRRMGWDNLDWVSIVEDDFHRDLGFLHTEEELRPFLEGEIPPTVEQNARMCGTDVTGYVSEGPGLSVYINSDRVVYRTYVTTARGLEPAMGYYGLLDRTPMGRNESEPLWVRRHDEYEQAA
jgi:predicted dithiol-disulfide oxidoreductase (DUF899 family)